MKEPFCWWFLITSVVPLTIYSDSPPLVEGDHLVQAFVNLFFFAHVLVEVQFIGYKFGLKG